MVSGSTARGDFVGCRRMLLRYGAKSTRGRVYGGAPAATASR